MKIFCHHLNFPFNSGIKKIAKPINSIPINAIRTEAAVITNRVRSVFLQKTSSLNAFQKLIPSFLGGVI